MTLKFNPADGAPDAETARQIEALKAACYAERPRNYLCATCWNEPVRFERSECALCQRERNRIAADPDHYR